MGIIVAEQLHAQMDMLLIRKIGHLKSYDPAIGAVGLENDSSQIT